MANYLINALPGGALIGRQFAGRPVTLTEVLAADRPPIPGCGPGWAEDHDPRCPSSTGGGGGCLGSPRLKSAVGHGGTAAVLSTLLGREVEERRVTLALQPGDVLYVAALRGPRLAEGQILSADEVAARGCDWLRVEMMR